MKFIIHQSASSFEDAQSSAWAKQLHDSLKNQGNIKVDAQLTDIAIDLYENNLTPKDNQEHHIVFLASLDDMVLLSQLKKMETVPQVVWSGLSIPAQLLDAKQAMPDITIVPEWAVDTEQRLVLSEKTLLLGTNVINHQFDYDFNELDYKRYLESNEIDDVQASVIGIQLESTLQEENDEAFFNSIMRVIQNEYFTKKHRFDIAIASPIYTNEKNSENDRFRTSKFAELLTEQLKANQIVDVNVWALLEREEPLAPFEALIHMVERSPKAIYFIPSSEANLLARSQVTSVIGSDVIVYGNKNKSLTDSLTAQNFVRTVDYYFEALSPKLNIALEYIKGGNVIDCINILASKAVELAHKRSDLDLHQCKPEPFSSALSRPKTILKSPNSAFTKVSAEQSKTGKKQVRITNELSCAQLSEGHIDELERLQKNKNIYKEKNHSTFWQTVGMGVAVGAVAAVVAMNTYNSNR